MVAEFSFVSGSILDLNPTPDAIVSSDDNHLSHGGGVSRAIWKKAGHELEAEVSRIEPRLSLGDVFVTGGYGTGASRIFHAVSIDFDFYRRLEPADVRPLLVKVLARAIDLNVSSVALPMIGCGAGRLTPAAFLKEAETLASEWMCIPCPVNRIVIVDKELPPASQRSIQKEPHVNDHLPPAGTDGQSLARYLDTLAKATAAAYFEGFACLESLAGERPGKAVKPPVGDGTIALVERSLRRDLRPDERMLVQTARKYRNQFAHLGDETHDLDFLLTANRVVIGFHGLLTEITTTAGAKGPAVGWLTAPAVVGVMPTSISIASVIAASAAAIRGGKSASPTVITEAADGIFSLKEQLASQDDPVRRLKSLLQSQMDQEDLRSLKQRLIDKEGYAGDEDAILLEFCVRESPPEVLKELSHGRRLAVLQKLSGAESAPARDTDDAILELLGFTVRQRPRGITEIRRLVDSETNRIRHADTRIEVLGAATAIASELERALIILLRFIEKIDNSGQLVAGVLRQKATLDGQAQKIEKMSMGNLFAVLDGLVKALEKVEEHEDRHTRENQYLLAVRNSALVKTARDLSAKRNRVIHFDKELDVDRSIPSKPDPALRKAALEFGEHARQLLDVLCENEERLFPQVLRIEEIKTDSWGRRVIVAEDDEGRREKIFTRQELKPGMSYYMVPFNNPVRVDPLLVEAGNGIVGG